MLKFVILALISFNLFATSFKVSTYNIENLFDLNNDKTEYREFIPNTNSKWNNQNYNKKLRNIAFVIDELNSDILALQEIESSKALDDLNKALKKPFKYKLFKKYSSSSVGLGFLSNYKILDYSMIHVKNSKVNRPILKATFLIGNHTFTIFNNHWPSKRNKESQRVLYAQALKKYLEDFEEEYIILGDLNSNYNEAETFKYLKFNNTYGYTGINDVLFTRFNDDFVYKSNILDFEKNVHYNLWLELNFNDRFSYLFRNNKETPDNILLSKSMFDNKGIDYENESFKVFKPNYLYKNGKINRWEMKKRVHQGNGYSDHLPLISKFTTKKQTIKLKSKISKVKELYKAKDFNKEFKVSNLTLLYKTSKIAVLKGLDDRAIFVYKNVDKLKFNKLYTIKINKLKRYQGLLEIIDYSILNYHPYKKDYKELFLDASKNDIQNLNFQNEIITNISGTYKNSYLHYKFKNENKKIRIYAKNKALLPKDGQTISIMSAHLGFYRTKPQIVFYKKSDYINAH